MDLVSSLPDEVLCHILSFFTTKEAALTSVLSKRWRNLFALVPSLDIDFVDRVSISSLYPEEGIQRDAIRQSFMDFVDRVLALQGNSPIKKFSLKWKFGQADTDRVDGWISNVLARGVSELELYITPKDYYRLSPKYFKSKKLVKLKLGCRIDIDRLDGSIFLPMLKTLILESVMLYVDKFEILLNALPALEELVLVDIDWRDWDVTVSSASLKTLTICCNSYLDTFSVDTPSLVYFCYSAYALDDFSVVTMENLFEARISLFVTEDDIEPARAPYNDWLEDEDNVVNQFANVGKVMNGIRNVQFLDLCDDTLECSTTSKS